MKESSALFFEVLLVKKLRFVAYSISLGDGRKQRFFEGLAEFPPHVVGEERKLLRSSLLQGKSEVRLPEGQATKATRLRRLGA
jgi:hypothetical protein